VAELICRSQTATRLFSFVGRHTLPIFLLHVSIQKLLLLPDLRRMLPIDGAWFAGLLTAMLAVVIAVLVEQLLIARVAALRYLFLPERVS
jgi:hypothetical protein